MKDIFCNSLYFGAAISILAYAWGVYLHKRLRLFFLNPLLISIISVIAFLIVLQIEFETYERGAKYLTYLLTPATVCLAIPLYQQMDLLKKHFQAVILGILAGVLSSGCSILLLSLLFQLSKQQYLTLLPKSITAAIGIGLSQELGGIPTITVASIIVTGVFGNIFAENICKFLRIKEPLAIGLAIGTATHAMGTVKALEMGEVEGAMSSLSVAVAGLLTVVVAPFFANLF